MISSISSRVVTPVQTAVAKPPETTAKTTAPTTTSYFQDTLEVARRRPLDLSGFGNTPPAAVPALAKQHVPEAGGSTRLGPEFLHLDAGWIPQGQGYDAKRGEVLTTYYDDSHNVLLSVQDKRSGNETQQVRLGGRSPDDPAGPPTHGGGVSTNGKFVYVADTEHIYVYTREELERAARTGTEAQAFDVTEVLVSENVDDPASDLDLRSRASFMTVKGDYAYVGGYSPNEDDKAGAVWRYKIADDGSIIEGSRQGPIRAPDQAQGMTVVDGALVFTTGSQKLYYQPFEESESSFEADVEDRKEIGNGLIDPYAQGVNIIDGEVWVTYESGSHEYRDELGEGEVPRTHIQRIPLEDLDLEEAGLTPEQLGG